MKKFYLLVLLCCTTFTITLAQNTASIKGKITDSLSKKPLGLSTVAVVNAGDTSLVSYTVTKDDGTFLLSRLPIARSLKLIVTYVGFNTFRKDLELKPGLLDFGTIELKGRSLEEVVINGARSPVTVKKDTIEFSAEAFKTRPNAAVEELLRLLPGVQVNQNGGVLVNGRGTSRILIDGKEFFGTNQLVALKNLDAELIDKIQVYLDRENDPDRKVNEIDLQNVINLKLKSAVKKSTIGRFSAGVGTRERYATSGIVSNFRDTLQVSVMANANNLNSTGFSEDELYGMGGFNRSGTEQIDGGNFGGNQSGGLTNVKSGGLNLNNDYGKELKLNLAYFYGNTIKTNRTKNLNEQSLPNSAVLNSLRTDQSRNNSTTHSIGGLLEWKPDTNTTLRYRPNLSFSPARYNQTSFLNQYNDLNNLTETEGSYKTKSYSDNFSHNLNFYHRFKKGRSLTINNLVTLNGGGNDSYNFNQLNSFSQDIPSSLFDRYVHSGSKTKWTGLSMMYNLPLTKKLTAEFFTNSRYYYWSEPVYTYDKNAGTAAYDQFVSNQSNGFVRTGFFQNIKPLLNYQITNKLRLRLAIDLEIQDVHNKFDAAAPDLRQRFAVWLPSLAIDYDGFSINYSEWIDLPSLYHMQPLERQTSAQYTFLGNPRLKASRVRNLRGNFYKHINARMLSINGYVNFTFYNNSFVQRTVIDTNGFTNATVINKDGSNNANAGFYLRKQFKKTKDWQLGLGTGVSGYFQNYIVYLNNAEARQKSASVTFNQDFNMNYKSAVMINAYYSFNRYKLGYDNKSFSDIVNQTHYLGATGTFRFPKRIVLEPNYYFRYNSQIAPGFPKSSHIVNIALSLLTQKKDRGEVKLSVYDLLNQNISVSRYGNLNAIITNEQQILRRYVMLSYRYKFNVLKTI
ncbi:TonB-dependent receptor [Pedobacter sp. GR22-6]|uniref:TonB-dependent receptor n=1 Tax=Pedobacter sp. GR22-6 TaxID=3127957 RepID=UPI00307E2ACB